MSNSEASFELSETYIGGAKQGLCAGQLCAVFFHTVSNGFDIFEGYVCGRQFFREKHVFRAKVHFHLGEILYFRLVAGTIIQCAV